MVMCPNTHARVLSLLAAASWVPYGLNTTVSSVAALSWFRRACPGYCDRKRHLAEHLIDKKAWG
jgi:hypothetical protein